MKLYIKQSVISITDKFSIYDKDKKEVFKVQGQLISLGKKLRVYDRTGKECAMVSRQLISVLPKYDIIKNGKEVAEVAKKVSAFRPKYAVNGLNWDVDGSILEHDYELVSGRKTLAKISKRWVSWGDTYEIDIREGVDPEMVACVVIAIDAIAADEDTKKKVQGDK